MRLIPKILFIDDDNFFLEFYRAELSQEDISTDFARDGEDGIKKAIELKPDIILLDVILPIKDGFEVIKELKANPDTKDIPVIIVTTLSAQDDMDRLLASGAVKVFNKINQLPKDIIDFIRGKLKGGEFKLREATETGPKATTLSKEEIEKSFKESLKEVEKTLSTFFNKKSSLEDINMSLMPFSEFKTYMNEMAEHYGSISVYSEIEAKTSGMAILNMKRDDTLNFIKLIGEGMLGKDMGFSLSDRVVEEFFNIVVNAFLNKFASAMGDRMILKSAIITNPKYVAAALQKTQMLKKDNESVFFTEEDYLIEEYGLKFSLFIIIGTSVYEKN